MLIRCLQMSVELSLLTFHPHNITLLPLQSTSTLAAGSTEYLDFTMQTFWILDSGVWLDPPVKISSPWHKVIMSARYRGSISPQIPKRILKRKTLVGSDRVKWHTGYMGRTSRWRFVAGGARSSFSHRKPVGMRGMQSGNTVMEGAAVAGQIARKNGKRKR